MSAGEMYRVALEQIDADLEKLTFRVAEAEEEVFDALREPGDDSEPEEGVLEEVEAGIDGLLWLKVCLRRLRGEVGALLAEQKPGKELDFG